MTDTREPIVLPPGAATGEPSVVRGRLDLRPDAERAKLRRFVEDGGALLIAPAADDLEAQALAGVRVTADLPRTEWFVTLAPGPAAARLDGEVPIVSGLALLEATDGATWVAATTSVHGQHRPTLTVRTLGRGIVIASGIVDLEALQRHEVLVRYLDRLLRRSTPLRTTPFGVGIVGYGPFGGMGHAHGLAITATEGLRLHAATDTDPARLEAARQDFPDLVIAATLADLAADPDVDVAIIATPPVHHAAIALELLEAGKHVVVEKPMCLTVEDADRLLAAATANDRTLTVHQSRRWDPDFMTLERLIARGRVGDVFELETFVGTYEHPCRAWHSEVTVSGGAVYDWGSHHIDWILRLYGGPPARLMTSSHTRVWHDTTNADHLSVWMQWADGREATFRQSDLAAIRRPKFRVQGTLGTIEGHYRPVVTERIEAGLGFVADVSHHAEAPVDLTVVRHESGLGLVEEVVRVANRRGWPFHERLADHLILGEAVPVPAAQSREVVRVLEAAHRSGSDGGTPIELG
jgi:scyllo-inositol 2-dehydrogenase (NADP+)